MLADLFFALRRGVDQLTYWAQTYLPFNRWRAATEAVVSEAREEAARYGLTDVEVDRRRAYQVGRVVVANRHGDHLVDLVPDAWGIYSPTSCATIHAGRKSLQPIAERRQEFRRHPQTLAYLLTPPALSRLGLGGSARGTVVGIPTGEPTPPAGAVASRLRQELDGGGGRALDEYARIVVSLHAGPAREQEEEATAEAA